MTGPTRTSLDRQLRGLEDEVIATAARVAEAVAMTGEALASGDHELAAEVVRSHPELERATRVTEAHGFALLARQQPAAGDLRAVLTVVRLSHELERASKLTRHVAAFAAEPRSYLGDHLRALLARMAEEAVGLLQGAVDAYAERDVERAEALDVWDDRMDELHRRLLAALLTGSERRETTLELALVGRYLERIADHAVVMGNRVRYLVRGEL